MRRALRPRALLRFLLRPATLLAIVVLAGLAVALTLVGPFGFASSFNKVAGSNTYGPVSPVETLGVWLDLQLPPRRARRRRPARAGRGDRGPGAAGRRRLVGASGAKPTIPIALGACAVLYLVSLPFSGDYSQAKALMIAAPLAMLVAVKPLLWEFPSLAATTGAASRLCCAAGLGGARRSSFVGGAVYSSLLVLRDAPVAPPGHGGELQAFLPIVHGEPVLYAGQDRYAAYELLGADTHVPLVEFPDDSGLPQPGKAVRHRRRLQPDRLRLLLRETLDRFPYVVTSRAAWNSQAPPNFKRIAATPSYVLWERTGTTPENRHVLLEGIEAGALAGCDSPEIRILLANPGRASLFPDAVIGPKSAWDEGSVLGTGAETSQALDLPAGTWNLSLQYFSPFDLTLSAPGFERAADRRARRPAPEHDQPRQQRPVLARRPLRERRRQDHLHPRSRRRQRPAEPHRLRRQGLRRRAGRRPGRSRTATVALAAGLRRLDRLVRSRRRRTRVGASAGARRLWRQSLGRDPDHVPDQVDLLEAVDDQGGDVDLVPAQAVGGRGREGVVAVVEGLAEGRDRDQGEVARVVGGLEFAVAEDVAERVDAVGEVVEDEDADEAAPEQAGEAGEDRAADRPAERRRGAAGRRSPSR